MSIDERSKKVILLTEKRGIVLFARFVLLHKYILLQANKQEGNCMFHFSNQKILPWLCFLSNHVKIPVSALTLMIVLILKAPFYEKCIFIRFSAPDFVLIYCIYYPNWMHGTQFGEAMFEADFLLKQIAFNCVVHSDGMVSPRASRVINQLRSQVLFSFSFSCEPIFMIF